MYSPQLEELIELILADNVITEKERAVLHKRAIAEGVDPDEIDIVIEGRLAKRNRASAPVPPATPVPPPLNAETPVKPKSNKHGEIRKCPNCGATVGAAVVKCDECGYDFVGVATNSSRERLYNIIQEIKERRSRKQQSKGILGGILSSHFGYEKLEDQEIAEAISSMPIPTTKEDLLEFLMYLEPLACVGMFSGSYHALLTPAYKAKYKECCHKAELFFSDDPLFIKFFSQKKKGFFGK